MLFDTPFNDFDELDEPDPPKQHNIDVIDHLTLLAVECAACKQLHKAGSGGYIIIHGAIRGYSNRSRSEVIRQFGTADGPKVVCRSTACVIKVIDEGGELGLEHD